MWQNAILSLFAMFFIVLSSFILFQTWPSLSAESFSVTDESQTSCGAQIANLETKYKQLNASYTQKLADLKESYDSLIKNLNNSVQAHIEGQAQKSGLTNALSKI